jgi:hypothetical protein
MAEEKGPTEFEKPALDRSTTEESGDAIDEKQLLRKIDWHLIPGLGLLLMLSFLDRSNGNHSFLSSFTFRSSFLQLEMLLSKVWRQIYT